MDNLLPVVFGLIIFVFLPTLGVIYIWRKIDKRAFVKRCYLYGISLAVLLILWSQPNAIHEYQNSLARAQAQLVSGLILAVLFIVFPFFIGIQYFSSKISKRGSNSVH